MSEPITIRTFLQSDGVEDWRVVSDGACAFFATGSFAESAAFATAIAALPGIDRRGSGIDIRHDGVTVRLATMNERQFGLSDRDLELAREVSRSAREQGVAARPSAVQSVLIIPAGPSVPDIRPFWQAVLAYEPRPDSPDEDLVDPHDRGPALWLEQMQEARADGGGAIHIAVWVGPDEAEARLAAVLAAGGRLVRDDFAPAWWTVADAAGNEADIATAQYRD
jgi:4a-hydroxytetrahydrobiopterin dehydratase